MNQTDNFKFFTFQKNRNFENVNSEQTIPNRLINLTRGSDFHFEYDLFVLISPVSNRVIKENNSKFNYYFSTINFPS
jgi:hypothetical protein